MAEEKKKETNEELLARIEQATKKLDDANAKFEENRIAAEKARVERMISGSGEAGIQAEKKEESPAEYAEKIMAGDKP